MPHKKITKKQLEERLAGQADIPPEFQLRHRGAVSAFVVDVLKRVDKRPPLLPPTAEELALREQIRKRLRRIARGAFDKK